MRWPPRPDRRLAHLSMALGLLLLAACTDGEDGDGDGDGANGDADTAGGADGAGGPGSGSCRASERRAGEATYYDADGSGNCSFPASPEDLLVGAMNAADYDGSAVCGTCVAIDGPEGSVSVRIVDQCPECQPGDIDLSPQAFELIAPLPDGRVPIEWEYVPCDVDGPIEYHFKDGSNPWWTAVQVRNHRHAVASFEVYLPDQASDADGWVDVPRFDYNYFVLESGMGEGPLRFRVTDVWGNAVEDDDVPLLDPLTGEGRAPGSAQFPTCE